MESTQALPDCFPAKPKDVPKDLAKATPRYRFHAWLAMGGLVLFAGIYVGLAVWFGWSAYRLFDVANRTGKILEGVKAFGAAVLALFLVKGLFFRKISGGSKDFEVTADTQPRLFEFLHRLAKETGAPRPHKVFLSPDVNACVFYDLSILNFLFPTRKNLEIGLGLVNVLTLSEFKAVLSHEFGHFGQKSMAVGRWVYTAQQVAAQLVYHRDWLDGFLGFLSRIDLRVAWIGWLVRLVVWSLRAILDTLLNLVMIAQRALSREMEFQADLVAVSTSGSDALIHGLYRLPAADQAWASAQDFIGSEVSKGFTTADVFAVQYRTLEHHRRILDDPELAAAPAVPETNPEQHRIFTPDLAQPPQMWATHPANHLREQNAKKTYVAAQPDSRSAWDIFDSPERLREELSAHMFQGLEQLLEQNLEQRPLAETLKILDQGFDRERYKPAYHGCYLARSIVEHAKSPSQLYHNEERDGPLGSYGELYPESLTEEIEKHRNLDKEKALLSALRDRTYEPPDGKIRFRGRIIKRSGLGDAIDQVALQLGECEGALRLHDRKCRSHHDRFAAGFSDQWRDYLRSLLNVHHYAEHGLRDLTDANAKLDNTFAVITADGNVSSKELGRLLCDAADLHGALKKAYIGRKSVVLCQPLRDRMGGEDWRKHMPRFALIPPTAEVLGDWLPEVSDLLEPGG